MFVNHAEISTIFIPGILESSKFTPPGGRVTIGVERLNLGYQVSICDTGIGDPSEDLPLLFARFFRGTNATDNEIPGTGIGLCIVRSVIEKHSGAVKVRSEIGKGSQFDVWLSIAPSS